MLNAATRLRTVALPALAVAALTTGTVACTESPEEAAATSTTVSTLPPESPSVAWVWADPAEETGEDVRVPVYASLVGGTVDDELTGVSVDPELAAEALIVPEDEAPVDLPASTTVNLSEGSVHLELVGLEKPLEYNRAFEVTLQFENAEDLKVMAQIRNPIDPSATD